MSQGAFTAFAEFSDVTETGSRCAVEFAPARFEGSCRTFTCQQTTLSPVSAGKVTIRGPGQSFVLNPDPDNTYDLVFGQALPWKGGEELRISAKGAQSGFPGFQHDFHFPTGATLTSPDIPPQGTIIDRSQPLDFIWAPVWRPNQAKSTFTVTAGTFDGSKSIQCDFPLTEYKRGQVPATLLSALPATTEAFLAFDVRQERAQFLNRGTDFVLTAVTNTAAMPSGETANWTVAFQ